MSSSQALAFNWGRSGARAALAVGSAIILMAFMCVSAVKADEQDQLRDVLDAAAGHDQAGWAYTRTLLIRAGRAGGREKVSLVEKFDPSKPPGEQLKRVKIREDGGDVTTEYDDDSEVDVDHVVYADLAEIEFENAELVSDSDDEAVYRLSGEDGQYFQFGDANFGGESLMDHVYGELVVQKTGPAAPYVSEVRISNGDERGGLLADIETLAISYRFAPSPDGKTYLSQGFDFELELEVLIFIDIYVDIVSEYTDYNYVGEYKS